MTWTAVHRVPRGTWTFLTLHCGHIRVYASPELPEQWELSYCLLCREYRAALQAGRVNVR